MGKLEQEPKVTVTTVQSRSLARDERRDDIISLEDQFQCVFAGGCNSQPPGLKQSASVVCRLGLGNTDYLHNHCLLQNEYAIPQQHRGTVATGTDNCQPCKLELERVSLDLVWTEAYHIPQVIHTSYPSNISDS